MQAIIFALIAFIGWGTGDVFGGIVSRKIGGYSSTFWLYAYSLFVSSLFIPFAIGQLHNVTLNVVLLLFFLNIIGTIPVISLYEGIRVGNASLVGTIAGAFAAITVILSTVFLGDSLSLPQAFSIIIIFIGLVLSSLNLKTFKAKQLFSDKGVPYALLAMVLWGVYFTLLRIPSRQIGWFWSSYLTIFAVIPLYIFMKIRKIALKFPRGKNVITSSLLNSLMLSVAYYAYNFSITKGQTAIVTPIAGSYPVLFVLVAHVVFKDPLKKQQILGIVVNLVGIVLLAVFSSG